MSKDTTHQIMTYLMDIKGELGTLHGKADGINSHLANLNGRVVTHTEQINEMKSELSGIKTKIAMYTSAIGTVVAVGWGFIKEKIHI